MTSAAPPTNLTPSHIEVIQSVLGSDPVGWSGVVGGYSSAGRWVVEAKDGSRAFIKTGTTEWTSEALRAEAKMYQALEGEAYLPKLLGFQDDAASPILVLEDLSPLHQPPPWSASDVEATRASLRQISRRRDIAASLTCVSDHFLGDFGWASIAADPGPFLHLGWCSDSWLHQALPALTTAQRAAPLVGEGLLHLDVRSDNLAIRDDLAILFDWNWACRGNPDIDLAFWSPSLKLEGGPPPEQLLPDSPELAALVSGFFCAQAPLPQNPEAPHVREFQKRQASVALPWVVRALGLPPPKLSAS